MPGGCSGAIHLVLSVQDEKDVDGTGQLGVGSVAGLQVGVQHVQEVLGVAQPLVGGRVHPPAGSVIGQSGNGWDLACSHTVTLWVSLTEAPRVG